MDTNRTPYNASRISVMTTEHIEAELAKAQAAVNADAGKRYRGYKFEAQLQRIRRLQFWARVLKDRNEGLV